MHELLEYIFTLLESILFFNFLSDTLKKKENVNYFIFRLSVGLYFIIISLVTNFSYSSNSALVIIILISLIYATCIYNGNLRRKAMFTIIFFMALVLCDVLTANILGITMRINIQEVIFTKEWFRVFLFCMSKITLILILKTISYFIGNDKFHIPSKYWYMIMFTFLTSLLILMVIGKIGISTPYYNNEAIYFVITCIGILLINIFVQYIFIQLGKYYKKEQIYNIIEVRNEMMEKYYREREQVYSETRKLGHDFKNHLFCILTLLDSNKIAEAKKYAEDICETITIQSIIIKSGNDIVDIILNQKYAEAHKLEIHMEINAIVPIDVGITSMDICAILANIIDNAIEAVTKIKDESHRRIKVKICPYKNYLLISVSNTFESDSLEDIKKFRTTKIDTKNHGLGISIVKNVVNKYNGSIEYSFDNNEITVKILTFIDKIANG